MTSLGISGSAAGPGAGDLLSGDWPAAAGCASRTGKEVRLGTDMTDLGLPQARGGHDILRGTSFRTTTLTFLRFYSRRRGDATARFPYTSPKRPRGPSHPLLARRASVGDVGDEWRAAGRRDPGQRL